MSRRFWFRLAALLAGIAVIVLAMAAHWLESHLPPEKLRSIESAAELQFLHALAMLILSYPAEGNLMKARKRVLFLMFGGILLFSGSIYLLSLRTLAGMEWLKFLWPLTPSGGILLILSWFLLALDRK